MSAAEAQELAFRRDQADASLQSVRVASLLGILAFVAFAFVDPFIAPLGLSLLLKVRTVVVLILVMVFASTFSAGATRWAREAVMAVSIATCLWIGGGVIVVTALVGGAATNYHEALLLTFFAFSAFPLPWRWPHSLATYGVTVAAYDIVMIALDLRGSTAQWLTVNAVLWFAVIIASAITWHAGNLRRQEFSTRAQLGAANVQLQALDAAKTAFFTNISHELRTPLTLVLAPLESLLEQAKDFSPAQDEQLSLARRSALRLLRLVDDLLMLSRIEGAALRLYASTFDLRVLVRKLTEEAGALGSRKRMAVEFVAPDQPVTIRGDEEQIERVMLNLLANALKFTPPGGLVRVTVEQHAGAVSVAVADTGPGIPDAQREQVFERFHQVEQSEGRRVGGTGIGLSLARELILLHGGEIHAEPNPGGGSILRFTLPTGQAGQNDSLPVKREVNVGMPEWHEQIRRGDEYRLLGLDEATERRLGRRRVQEGGRGTILVIEDNADMVRFLAGVLGSEFTVLAASDGRTGLRLAGERRPDLILSDVMMPGMTGWEVVAHLREDPQTRGIPIVLLTARGTPEDRMHGHAEGADAYLTKPFQVTELLTVIRGLLRNQDDRETLGAARTEEALEGLIGGVLATVGTPAQELLADPQDALAADRLRGALGSLAALLPDASAVRQRIELAVLVRSAMKQLGPEASRIDADIGATRTVFVQVDSMERAIVELLRNALRASPRERQVRLEARDEGSGSVRLAVRDDGPGVPAAARDRVFQPFYSSTGRAGLGLTLARRVVRAHGGTLALDAEERPVGASFSLRLPTGDTPERREGPT